MTANELRQVRRRIRAIERRLRIIILIRKYQALAEQDVSDRLLIEFGWES